MADIENLEINISASAGKAAGAVDRLASSLGKAAKESENVHASSRKTVGAINDVASSAKNAGNSARNFHDKLAAITKISAKDNFKGLSVSFNAVSTALRRITTGVQKVSSITGKIVPALGNMASMLAKDMFSGAKRAANGLSDFMRSLRRIATYRLLRTLIKEITQGFSQGLKNLYAWSDALNGTFAQSMDRMATASQYLKNSLAAMASPLLESLAPAIDYIVDKFVDMFNIVNQILARLAGRTSYTAAKKVAAQWDDASKKASGSAKKAADDIKRTILSFDEINKLNDANSRSGSGGGGSGNNGIDASGMFETRPISSWLSEIVDSGDYTLIGKAIANKINKALGSIDWEGLKTQASSITDSITSLLNGFIEAIDPAVLGLSLAEVINTAMTFIDSFWTKVNWAIAGQKLHDAIQKFFESIDVELAADALLGKFRSIVTLISNAIPQSTEEWNVIGVKLSLFIQRAIYNIPWDGLGDIAGGLITGALKVANILVDPETVDHIATGIETIIKTAYDKITLVNIDPTDLGNRLAGVVNSAASHMVNVFAHIRWAMLGEKLRKLIVGFFENIDVEACAGALINGFAGLVSLVANAIPKTNEEWQIITDKVTNFIVGAVMRIPWADIGTVIGGIIKLGIKSIASLADAGVLTKIANGIKDAIEEACKSITKEDVTNLVTSVLKDVVSAIGVIMSIQIDLGPISMSPLTIAVLSTGIWTMLKGAFAKIFGGMFFGARGFFFAAGIMLGIEAIVKLADIIKGFISTGNINWGKAVGFVKDAVKAASMFLAARGHYGAAIVAFGVSLIIEPTVTAITGIVDAIKNKKPLDTSDIITVITSLMKLSGFVVMGKGLSKFKGIAGAGAAAGGGAGAALSTLIPVFGLGVSLIMFGNDLSSTFKNIETTGAVSTDDIKNLIGDAFIAAGFLGIMAGFDPTLGVVTITVGVVLKYVIQKVVRSNEYATFANKFFGFLSGSSPSKTNEITSNLGNVGGGDISKGADTIKSLNNSASSSKGMPQTKEEWDALYENAEHSRGMSMIPESWKESPYYRGYDPGDPAHRSIKTILNVSKIKSAVNSAAGKNLVAQNWATGFLKAWLSPGFEKYKQKAILGALREIDMRTGTSKQFKTGDPNSLPENWKPVLRQNSLANGGGSSVGWALRVPIKFTTTKNSTKPIDDVKKNPITAMVNFVQNTTGGVFGTLNGLFSKWFKGGDKGKTEVDADVKLKKDGWTTLTSFVGDSTTAAVNLKRGNYTTLSNFVGSWVQVALYLVPGNAATSAVMGAMIGIGRRANGGVFNGGSWSDIPQYAGGTANAHGSLFMAGEAGPEIVGHIGGRTEVLNKSQLAAAIYTAVTSAMAPASANFRAASESLNRGANEKDAEMLLEFVRTGSDAVLRQNELLKQQNDLLRQINAKEFKTEVTTMAINDAQRRTNQRNGVAVAIG